MNTCRSRLCLWSEVALLSAVGIGGAITLAPESVFAQVEEPLASPSVSGPIANPGLCFTIGGTTVTDYAVDVPGCGRDVVIPDGVTEIESGAFRGKGLTQVRFPDSLTTIDAYAFRDNALTAVTFPASVTEIGARAFEQNRLGSARFTAWPSASSVRAEPFGAGNAPFGSGGLGPWGYVPVYGPAEGAPASRQFDPAAAYDTTIVGAAGMLVNPAQVTVQYRDATGNAVAPDVTYVGPSRTSYEVSVNPDAPGDFSGYYVAGQSPTITAPSVTGFTTPDAQRPVLAAGLNTVTFTYGASEPAASTARAAASVVMHPDTVRPGEQVTVSGSGFAADEMLAVWLHTTPVKLAMARADGTGSFTVTVTIPVDVAFGTHEIEVVGITDQVAVSRPVAVVSSTAPATEIASALPDTGFVVAPFGVTGGALLLAGLGFVWWRNRRERH